MGSKLTHMREVCILCSFEVPADRSHCLYFTPHLAGDATQFEALIDDSLSVRVQFHTGSTAQGSCRAQRMKNRWWWKWCSVLLMAARFQPGSNYRKTWQKCCDKCKLPNHVACFPPKSICLHFFFLFLFNECASFFFFTLFFHFHSTIWIYFLYLDYFHQ